MDNLALIIVYAIVRTDFDQRKVLVSKGDNIGCKLWILRVGL
jgi:hypothetical protein